MKTSFAAPVSDLFTPIADAADADVLAGLAALQRSSPLWDTGTARWFDLVSALIAFETRWGASARSCGWDGPSLYGLSPRSPRAALWRMGAAWLVALRGDRVTAIDAKAVHLVSRTSSRLSIYRPEADRGAVLPWLNRPSDLPDLR